MITFVMPVARLATPLNAGSKPTPTLLHLKVALPAAFIFAGTKQ